VHWVRITLRAGKCNDYMIAENKVCGERKVTLYWKHELLGIYESKELAKKQALLHSESMSKDTNS
jgi:hypothetical protein